MADPLEGVAELLGALEAGLPQEERERPRLEEIFCQHVSSVCLWQAYHTGLSESESWDCAQELVVRLLQTLREHGRVPASEPAYVAWLHVCACHHVANTLRSRNRSERHLLPLDAAVKLYTPPHQEGVSLLEQNWGREEFWRRMHEALAQMEAAPKQMLLEHYRERADIAEIASAHGRTVEAVTQSLYRSRKRLRELLTSMGWTETHLRDLLED
jgi:RNA polymerase sigma factor (sigma-70 family)